MKVLAIILALISAQINSQAQVKRRYPDLFIKDVFMKLSDLGLNESEKKQLLKKSRLTIGERIVTIDLDTVKNFVFIQFCFDGSMTMPCDNHYIKSYQSKNGAHKIIYSRNSNSPADRHQDPIDLLIYDAKTGALSKIANEYKALNLTLKDFFKADTPDSVLLKYSDYVSPIFSFTKNKIFWSISDNGHSNTLLSESHLVANLIEIEWNGKAFLIKSKYKNQD